MFIFKYPFWHYFEAPADILKIWRNFLKFFVFYLFPVPLLLKTLFKPWKRDVANQDSSFEKLLPNLLDQFASRFVGFLVRISVIAVAITLEITTIIFGVMFFIFWFLSPIIILTLFLSSQFSIIPIGIVIGLSFCFLLFISYKTSNEKPANELKFKEIFKKPWSKEIWERIGVNIENVPKDLIKSLQDENHDEPQDKLDEFLKQNGIEKKDFETAFIWEISKQQDIYLKKRFWREENLFNLEGLGRDWAYGHTSLLNQYSEPINALANYEHLLGRRAELDAIERILEKNNQSNVLIIGEPGVGKMSLAQKFSRLVKTGRISPLLAYREVIMLNLRQAIAGLKTTGEIEARLIALFTQAKLAGNVILIINDFHDFQNISRVILPFLEGGYFQLIAITTYKGLHEQIEKRPELLSYFEKVEVKEPDLETVKTICEDSVREIETRVPVRITIQAINEIVEKSETYITDTPFPEKAIDLLEDSAIFAHKNSSYLVKPAHVDAVISSQTEMPVGQIESFEKEKLLNLEKLLHQRIISQEQAVTEIASAMRRSRLEISEKKRPIASFLFLGPTGVGKTETAKALAEIYFGSEEKVNRFDMSEFQGSSAIEKMIGSQQKGLTGFLTTAVKENPFSLLLLDEIEKADYGVLNLFLQVLEEGRLTDSLNRKINFRNQIIIATSNAGAEFIREKISEKNDTDLNKELVNIIIKQQIFKPEFLNRFDGIIIFKPLTPADLLKIAELMLNGLKKRLAKNDLIFNFNPELVEKIAEQGYEPINGARPMRRVIQKKVEDLIAKKLLKNEITKKQPFEIKAEEI
ncbi:MAG: ATP-dependent Clp protease ATP-binding subunit [bacterium]|nr:ATP-dependent Clp protease ATP-binding subunit [bacterium]